MAQSNSYAQTEQYFINHCDNLMPRVHQMRTDLAQYYHSNKESIRLSYLTTEDEKMNFEINGTELLLRDINVFANTNANARAIMEQLRQLALSNNTAGASIYDLGNIIASDSVPEIKGVMKQSENKLNQQKAQEQQHQQQMQEQQIQAQQQDKESERNYDSQEAEKERRKDILVAEIRASGYGAMMDTNENQVSDLQDSLKDIRESEQYSDQMSLQREKETSKTNTNREKMILEREKLQTEKEVSDNNLQIARENKNQYDFKKSDKKDKK